MRLAIETTSPLARFAEEAGIALDGRLLARLEAEPQGRPLVFAVPTFRHHETSEMPASSRGSWPAVSITGGACALQCDHCKAAILEPMIAAPRPDLLEDVVERAIAQGAQGMLLSGGSNHRNEVEYGPFLPVIARIKARHPDFRIAVHTALVDRAMARSLAEAGVDDAMLDIIGAQDTVTQVYHLKRPVADFEASLAALEETSMRVVPHIVLGLHYGRFLGEWQALEIVARHRPAALVLVVAMPFYAKPPRAFATPDVHRVGRFFLDARARLPDTPLALGCARPAGRARLAIEAYAVAAGLDAIAHPSEGIVALARALGRETRIVARCCGAVAEEVLLLQAL